MAKTETTEFPVAQAKGIVKDLFEPNPLIYWGDFLFTITLGWAAFILAVRTPNFSLVQFFALLVAGLALYRAVLFVHVLAHMKKGTFRVLQMVWNLVCGFPLMIPSFIYVEVHIDHHRQRIYGTKNDPEYYDFALQNPFRIPLNLLTMLVAPTFFLFRFLVLTPLSYLIPPMRKPLWVLGSSLAAGGTYRRPLPDAREKREGWIQELATLAYGTAVIILMAKGILPWKVLIVWYLVAAFILFTNALRSMAAHCVRNPPDHEMTFEEQFLDSTNIPGNLIITPLWAPLGLRYHATHHLFPGMPYHSMGEAHRRLMRELPKNNPYPLATRKSLWGTLFDLWEEACRHHRAKA